MLEEKNKIMKTKTKNKSKSFVWERPSKPVVKHNINIAVIEKEKNKEVGLATLPEQVEAKTEKTIFNIGDKVKVPDSSIIFPNMLGTLQEGEGNELKVVFENGNEWAFPEKEENFLIKMNDKPAKDWPVSDENGTYFPDYENENNMLKFVKSSIFIIKINLLQVSETDWIFGYKYCYDVGNKAQRTEPLSNLKGSWITREGAVLKAIEEIKKELGDYYVNMVYHKAQRDVTGNLFEWLNKQEIFNKSKTKPEEVTDMVTDEGKALALNAQLEELEQKEAKVINGIMGFVEAGKALKEIHDSGLYKLRHDDWNEYCKTAYNGLEGKQAYRLISGYKTFEELRLELPKLSPIGEHSEAQLMLPTNESQTRPLQHVKEPEKKAQVWDEAVRSSGGKVPTAAKVEEVRNKLFPDSKPRGKGKGKNTDEQGREISAPYHKIWTPPPHPDREQENNSNDIPPQAPGQTSIYDSLGVQEKAGSYEAPTRSSNDEKLEPGLSKTLTPGNAEIVDNLPENLNETDLMKAVYKVLGRTPDLIINPKTPGQLHNISKVFLKLSSYNETFGEILSDIHLEKITRAIISVHFSETKEEWFLQLTESHSIHMCILSENDEFLKDAWDVVFYVGTDPENFTNEFAQFGSIWSHMKF